MTNNDPGPSSMDTDASAAGAEAQNPPSYWSSEAMETFDRYKEYHLKMHDFDHLQNCGNNVKPPENPNVITDSTCAKVKTHQKKNSWEMISSFTWREIVNWIK